MGKLLTITFIFTTFLLFINGYTLPKQQPQENESFLDTPPHYHSSEEIQDLFARLRKDYPNLVKVHSIGESDDNRDLTVIEITNNVNKRGILVPPFKYVANMHGDETVGRELMIYLAKYLLLNYGTNDEITRLVNTTDIFLMPSMNPDGFARSKVKNQNQSKYNLFLA